MKRLYNYEEAIDYFGVKRKWFDTHIRQRVPWRRAGVHVIAERTDLDKAWDDYWSERDDEGAQGSEGVEKGTAVCQSESPVSTRTRTAPGRSTSGTKVYDFKSVSAEIKARKTQKTGSSKSSGGA